MLETDSRKSQPWRYRHGRKVQRRLSPYFVGLALMRGMNIPNICTRPSDASRKVPESMPASVIGTSANDFKVRRPGGMIFMFEGQVQQKHRVSVYHQVSDLQVLQLP